MRILRLAMAQTNPTVGDIHDNTRVILEYVDRARELRADIVVFPELAIPGYPPEDLLFKSQFIRSNIDKMNEIVEASRDIAVVVGFADHDEHVYNAAAIACNGKMIGKYYKRYLPNYGVFDEKRYFEPGPHCPVFSVAGVPIGVNICEDIWEDNGPTDVQRLSGARLIINISASPFYMGKRSVLTKMLRTRALNNDLFVAYVNMVGGQDELVFDGGSIIFDPEGSVVVEAGTFREDLAIADLSIDMTHKSGKGEMLNHTNRPPSLQGIHTDTGIPDSKPLSNAGRPVIKSGDVEGDYDPMAEVYGALVMGTRDYVTKSGFKKVLIGLSGGIDSSVVATVAVDALGPENVTGVSMPSRYSSQGSIVDAKELSKNLGIELRMIPIEELFVTYQDVLEPHFKGLDEGLAEENLQSRIRGTTIMALSNKYGWLVLATGNKSEMAVGYATIYGDMVGGYAVIKDVPKMLVYSLAEYRNGLNNTAPIPESVITKPPSAELRLGQIDEDTLPPYPTLDPIIQAYVEDDKGFEEIVAMGFKSSVVRQIITMVDRNEYKRRQAPPGIKVTTRNFGRDRRMPIVNAHQPF